MVPSTHRARALNRSSRGEEDSRPHEGFEAAVREPKGLSMDRTKEVET